MIEKVFALGDVVQPKINDETAATIIKAMIFGYGCLGMIADVPIKQDSNGNNIRDLAFAVCESGDIYPIVDNDKWVVTGHYNFDGIMDAIKLDE